MIGSMIIAGFRGSVLNDTSPVIRDIRQYHQGGVILFDKDLATGKDRNIVDFNQVRELTDRLKNAADYPILIGIDQEGGYVTRLKKDKRFPETKTAAELGTIDCPETTQQEGKRIGKTLSECGLNINFAPVVDLNINPDNPIIGKYNRSFAADPEKVTIHAKAFIKGLREFGILNSLKHFPGHGSSREDSHLSIPDITESWTKEELLPFEALIREKMADTVMTGHLVNRKRDRYPASLSYETVTSLLRKELCYDGVVISDDLGMKAVSDNYRFEETIRLAVNAGVDILLFANMIDFDEDIVIKAHDTIIKLIKEKKIPLERIEESFRRISQLKTRIAC